MSAPNTPNSSQTTAPPNSPIFGNPLAIPDRLRAAIEAKNARKTAEEVEMETEEIARDIRRLMSRASIESLKPETEESTAILMKPARPGQGTRDPEAINLPERLARKIRLDAVKEALERERTESEWYQAMTNRELPESTASGEVGPSSPAPAAGTESMRKRDQLRHVAKGLLRRFSSQSPRGI